VLAKGQFRGEVQEATAALLTAACNVIDSYGTSVQTAGLLQPLQQQCSQLMSKATEAFDSDPHSCNSSIIVKEWVDSLLHPAADLLQSVFQLHSGFEQKAMQGLKEAAFASLEAHRAPEQPLLAAAVKHLARHSFPTIANSCVDWRLSLHQHSAMWAGFPSTVMPIGAAPVSYGAAYTAPPGGRTGGPYPSAGQPNSMGLACTPQAP